MEPSQVQIQLGEWIEKGFALWKDNAGLLILAGLIVFLLTVFSGGILAGPMFAGLLMITLALADGRRPPPPPVEVFNGFNYFLHSFLFVLVWGLALILAAAILSFIPCLGQLAAAFVVYAAQALLMFGLFLIVDQDMEFWPASLASYDKVKRNFWPFLALSFVSGLIGGIGGIACGIGVAVTAPIQACILTVAYRDLFGPRATVPSNAPLTPTAGT